MLTIFLECILCNLIYYSGLKRKPDEEEGGGTNERGGGGCSFQTENSTNNTAGEGPQTWAGLSATSWFHKCKSSAGEMLRSRKIFYL